MEWNGTGTICGNYISFIRLLFQDITDLGEIRVVANYDGQVDGEGGDA